MKEKTIGFHYNKIKFFKEMFQNSQKKNLKYLPPAELQKTFAIEEKIKLKKLDIINSKLCFPEIVLACSSSYVVLALRTGQSGW